MFFVRDLDPGRRWRSRSGRTAPPRRLGVTAGHAQARRHLAAGRCPARIAPALPGGAAPARLLDRARPAGAHPVEVDVVTALLRHERPRRGPAWRPAARLEGLAQGRVRGDLRARAGQRRPDHPAHGARPRSSAVHQAPRVAGRLVGGPRPAAPRAPRSGSAPRSTGQGNGLVVAREHATAPGQPAAEHDHVAADARPPARALLPVRPAEVAPVRATGGRSPGPEVVATRAPARARIRAKGALP